MTTKRKPSRHRRGYGDAHEARRRSLEPAVRAGLVDCVRCHERIERGEAWHLDHSDDRRGYLGCSHARCNLAAAAAKTNGIRAAKREPAPLRWSREWVEPEPGDVIDYGNGRIERY